jgi:ribonuclease HII
MKSNENLEELIKIENEVYFKLVEAEHEAARTDKRYSSKDALKAMQDAIKKIKINKKRGV